MLAIRRLGYALGAEVTGLDLRSPLDDGVIGELRKAWLEHVVLCFPDQDLDPVQQMAFCGRFGELDDNRARPHLNHPEFPSVTLVINKPTKVGAKQLSGVRADEWHSDGSYTNRPGVANFLLAKALPETGGDTMFANQYMAYETLSPAFKRLLESLEGVHDVSLSPDYQRLSSESREKRREAMPPAAHPVIRVHPETGRKSLYAGGFLRNFVGMSEEESKPIVTFLNDHAVRYEFLYRHRWKLGDLVMWDNRCAMHYAVLDYDQSELRSMQRCMLLPPESGRLFVGHT